MDFLEKPGTSLFFPDKARAPPNKDQTRSEFVMPELSQLIMIKNEDPKKIFNLINICIWDFTY